MRPVLLVLLTAIALLWPAFVNGGPFWFPDTSTYIRGADAGTVFLFDSPSEWSDRLAIADNGEGSNSSSEGSAVTSSDLSSADIKPTRPVLSGRSVYYGLLIYAPMRLIGPWGAIFLQSLIVASCLVFCLMVMTRKTDSRHGRRLTLAGLAVAALLTPLPYYTSMLMPDVYTGIIVVLLAVLLILGDRLSLTEKVLTALVCAAMATFHTSIFLLVIVCIGIAVLFQKNVKDAWRPIAGGAPIVIAAVLANVAFSAAITHALNKGPVSPPFLSARLVADGSGMQFLDKECERDPNSWTLCRYRSRLPVESDEFLWSESGERSVFGSASEVDQRALASEDKAFFLSVARDYPASVVGSAISGTFKLLTTFEIIHFNYAPDRVAAYEAAFPSEIARSMTQTRAAAATMPVELAAAVTLGSTLGGLAVIPFLFLRFSRKHGRIPIETFGVVAMLLLACIANAVICGALSSPTARYEMRIIWLVPFAAVALAALLGRSTERAEPRSAPT